MIFLPDGQVLVDPGLRHLDSRVACDLGVVAPANDLPARRAGDSDCGLVAEAAVGVDDLKAADPGRS